MFHQKTVQLAYVYSNYSESHSSLVLSASALCMLILPTTLSLILCGDTHNITIQSRKVAY